jgi:hypothetical protein
MMILPVEVTDLPIKWIFIVLSLAAIKYPIFPAVAFLKEFHYLLNGVSVSLLNQSAAWV